MAVKGVLKINDENKFNLMESVNVFLPFSEKKVYLLLLNSVL